MKPPPPEVERVLSWLGPPRAGARPARPAPAAGGQPGGRVEACLWALAGAAATFGLIRLMWGAL